MNKPSNGSLALMGAVAVVLSAFGAEASPFEMRDLPRGYMVASADSGQGHCGGHWNEGMCGARAISEWDTNSDGKLTRDEFIAYHARVHEGRCGGDWSEGMCGGRWGDGMCGARWSEGMCGARAFDTMDTNKDGRLTADELSAHRTRMRDRRK